MSGTWQGSLEKVDEYRFRIPKKYKPGMRVDGLIFTDEGFSKISVRIKHPNR